MTVCRQRGFNPNIMQMDQIIQLACTAGVQKKEEQLQKTGKYYEVTCREKYTLTTVHVCKA